MKGAIARAGLLPADISYINAHGTATLNNDIAEAFALNRLFGKDLPAFSSTKCYTGHTLAAAGAIEAVFSILNLQHQELYPVLNYDTPMPEMNLVPITSIQDNIAVHHILSNSFGFGGNNASLLFSKYD
jgi:3-oxoacyl-[acyl-carrier-protein] synthase-1